MGGPLEDATLLPSAGDAQRMIFWTARRRRNVTMLLNEIVRYCELKRVGRMQSGASFCKTRTWEL